MKLLTPKTLKVSRPNALYNIRRRTQRLEALNQIHTTCNQSLELSTVLKRALETTLKVLDLEAGDVLLADNEREELIPVINIGLPEALISDLTHRKYGQGLAGYAAQSKSPVVVTCVDKDPRVHSPAARRERYGSYVGIPLLAKNKLVGVMEVVSYKIHEFTREDVNWLNSIGHAIGMAIENAKLYESVKLQTAQLQKAILLLEESSSIFATMTQPTSLMQSILHKAKLLLGTPYIALVLSKPHNSIRYVYDPETFPESLNHHLHETLKCLHESAALQDKTIITFDFSAPAPGSVLPCTAHLESLTKAGFSKATCAPLFFNGISYGSILVFTTDQELSETDQLFFRIFANQVTVTLSNLQLYEKQKTIAENLKQQKLITDRQNTTLNRIITIHDELTKIILEGRGIKGLTKTLCTLTSNPVLVLNQNCKPICWDVPDPNRNLEAWQKSVDDIAKKLRQYILDGKLSNNSSGKQRATKLDLINEFNLPETYVISPIIASGDPLGYVVVMEQHGQLEQSDVMAIEHAATALALEMTKEQVAWEVELRLRGNLVEDLLSANYSDIQTLVERSQRLGQDLLKLSRVIVVQLQPENQTHFEASKLYSFVKKFVESEYPGSLVASKSDKFILLLATNETPAGANTTQKDTAAIQKFGDKLRSKIADMIYPVTVCVAIGSHVPHVSQLQKSYKEACQCLEVLKAFNVRNKTISFENLGISGLLLSVTDKEKLVNFVDETIGLLQSYDNQHSTSLTRTLEVFLDNGCNLRATAKALFVHLNTLLYRIKRIEEITGADLKNPQTRLSLHMAVKIMHLMHAIQN